MFNATDYTLMIILGVLLAVIWGLWKIIKMLTDELETES